MTTTMTEPDGRRAELRAFLKGRRGRVSPEQVGIAPGRRRRTPGLRREELAVLAGVGVSWYQWLEQGRDITVSGQVLDSVARVLRLNDSERRHLYVLAGLNPPLPDAWRQAPVGADLLRLIEGWMPKPAHILDRHWNLVAANRAAQLVLGYPGHGRHNCLVSFFTEPMYRELCGDHWRELARAVVAQYRGAMSAYTGDAYFAEIVAEVRDRSPEFAELWDRQEVGEGGTLHKILSHPQAGELHLDSTQLRVPERADLIVVLHSPVSGTHTAARLDRLLRADAEQVSQPA